MHITDVVAQILTTQCEHLDYGCTGLTDLDLEKICDALKENPSVKKIGLWNNFITVAGAAHIVNLITDPRCTLETINLNNNKINRIGVTQITDALATLDHHIEITLLRNIERSELFERPTHSSQLPPATGERKIGYRPS